MAGLLCQPMPNTLSFHHTINPKVKLFIYAEREGTLKGVATEGPHQKKVVVAPEDWL